MEFRALIHEEDGSYWAEVKELPRCFASGSTLDELKEALVEALGMCLTTSTERRRSTSTRCEFSSPHNGAPRGYAEVMKTAVVTGANTGIGLAIAERLLKDGFALGYATAGDDERHTGPLEALQATYTERNVTHVFGDLSDPATPQKLLEPFKTIDVLVNNAGHSTAKPFLELTVDDFDTTFNVDVRASFLLAQEAARKMPDGGSIINITSVHEHIPRPGFAVYAAAKAALGMLSRALAIELADRNIRVNSVAPGVIATPRNEEDAKELDPEVPLGRPGTPEEVAALVAWLASDEAAYATGQSYILDGGMTQQVVKLPAG